MKITKIKGCHFIHTKYLLDRVKYENFYLDVSANQLRTSDKFPASLFLFTCPMKTRPTKGTHQWTNCEKCIRFMPKLLPYSVIKSSLSITNFRDIGFAV